MVNAEFQETVYVDGKGWALCFKAPCDACDYEYTPKTGDPFIFNGKEYTVDGVEMFSVGPYFSVIVNEEIV